VPFFMRWPGVIPAGQTIDDPVIQLDLLPTFVSAAGGVLPPEQVVDGVDLLDRLTGETQTPPHSSLFWRTRGSTNGESAMRKDNWKLFRRDAVGGGSVQLYDLDTDIQETNDLAATQPQKLDELLADLTAWESEIIEPLWGVGLDKNTGEIVLIGGAIPAPSELGYEFSNDGPGFGHGLIRQRFPLATDEDWRLRFEMDLVDVEGLEQRGFVVLSPDTDLSQSIRLGLTASPPRMSIVEVAAGDIAKIDLALPPVGPTEYTIDFDSSENSLTMTWDVQTVTHILTATYEQFGYAGFAVRESRSRFSTITRDADAVAPASARH